MTTMQAQRAQTVGELVSELRAATAAGRDEHLAVAEVLARRRPAADLLSAGQRRGTAKRYANVLLHAEAGLSVSALVWRPGQGTVIHDHLTWCVAAVLTGTEREIRYELRGDRAVAVHELDNEVGSVSCLTPPGDIHRIVNTGDEVAITLHVYGVDLRHEASSVRRVYRLHRPA